MKRNWCCPSTSIKIFISMQVLLLVIICVQQSISNKIGEANTRWTYKNSDVKSLPDSIQIDLEFENDKITINLIKQSMGSIKLPLIMIQSDGQRSLWKSSENETLGVYKDYSYDASATVAIKNVTGMKETFYMLRFTHGNKSFSLRPSDLITEAFLDKSAETEDDKDKNNDDSSIRSKLIVIDGKLHSLVGTPLTKTLENLHKNKADLIQETRKKRSAQKPTERLMTVEILTIIDYKIYSKVFNESKATDDKGKKEEAMLKILYFFTHVMENMKNDYENIEITGLKFTTKWVGALIVQSPNDFFESEKFKIQPDMVNSTAALRSLIDWSKNEKAKRDDEPKFPNYDFIAAFTGHDIKNKEDSMLGISFLSSICESKAVSLIRHNRYYETKTASHELGHSLGALHDGNGTSCSAADFIMTPGKLEVPHFNNILFSNCSTAYFEETIRRLDNESKNCLIDGGEDFIRGREKDIFLQVYPGQIYDIDDQCRIYFGPKSYYCGGALNDEMMCQTIKCWDGYNCKTSRQLRAMDGTSCSTGSWCLRKKCVPNRRAPRAPERCINGDVAFAFVPDYPGYPTSKEEDERAETCKETVARRPDTCLSDSYENNCCASCQITPIFDKNCRDMSDICLTLEPKKCYKGYYNTTCCETCRTLVKNLLHSNCINGDRGTGCSELSCQDIVDECTSLEPRDCYSNYYNTTCCKTCRALTQNLSDSNCRYGDRGTGCSNLVPEICHLSTHFCCQTCAAYFSASPITTSKDSCVNGDYNGTLEYVNAWGVKFRLTCKQLIKRDSSLCYDESVQKYCCSSCDSIKMVEDNCKGDDNTVPHIYRSEKFTCKKLVDYLPRLCQDKSFKNKCCKSCRRFSVRPWRCQKPISSGNKQ